MTVNCPLVLAGPSFEGLMHCIGNLMADVLDSLLYMFLRNEQNKIICCSIKSFRFVLLNHIERCIQYILLRVMHQLNHM